MKKKEMRSILEEMGVEPHDVQVLLDVTGSRLEPWERRALLVQAMQRHQEELDSMADAEANVERVRQQDAEKQPPYDYEPATDAQIKEGDPEEYIKILEGRLEIAVRLLRPAFMAAVITQAIGEEGPPHSWTSDAGDLLSAEAARTGEPHTRDQSDDRITRLSEMGFIDRDAPGFEIVGVMSFDPMTGELKSVDMETGEMTTVDVAGDGPGSFDM